MDSIYQSASFKARALASLGILFIGWAFFFWPVIASIWGMRNTIPLNVATYVLTAFSLLFFFQARGVFKSAIFSSSQLGLMAVFVLTLAYTVSKASNLLYVEQASVILMLPALILTACGSMVIRASFIPVLFLMLIIPLQDPDFQYPEWIAGLTLGLLFYGIKFSERSVSLSASPISPLWALQHSRWLTPTSLALIFLMVSPWLGDNIRELHALYHSPITLRAPLASADWQGPLEVKSPVIAPFYPNASATLQVEYISEKSHPLYLYTAYYDSTRAFSELRDARNINFDPAKWISVSLSSPSILLASNSTLGVMEEVIRSGDQSYVCWYWYYVAGVSTVNPSLAELLNKVRLISKHAQGSGFMMIYTPLEGSDPALARTQLKSFLDTMYPYLDALKRPESDT